MSKYIEETRRNGTKKRSAFATLFFNVMHITFEV